MVSIFASKPSFQVVAKGNCAEDAISICIAHKPHIIVLDLNMPGDVYGSIETIKRTLPMTRIVAFTAGAGIDAAVKALEAGAAGYVLKGSTADELCDAIRAVLRGETFITQSLVAKVITALKSASCMDDTSVVRLSVREEQIVNLLLKGQTNKEIATQLEISEKTVKHYMTVLMQKLNARNRLEVVLAAQKMHKSKSPAYVQDAPSLTTDCRSDARANNNDHHCKQNLDFNAVKATTGNK